MRIAGAALAAYAARHDVIANNLANVSTPGFARQDTFFHTVASAGSPFRAPELGTRTVFEAGPPILTGNPLDLSLEGAGFFTVRTPEGIRYTRVGSLRVDAEGILRTPEGYAVLGENGLMEVGEGPVTIEKDGTVLVKGVVLDRLRLATFARGDDLERGPGGLYAARPGRRPDPRLERPIVHSGQIEGSSVSPVGELVEMLEALRAYEAAVAALRATDRTLDRAVNDIARI
jgi:flagellar basal-body rod protein FlgG